MNDGESSVSPPPAGRWARWVATGLLLAAIGALGALTPALAGRWTGAIRFPFQLDAEEGFVLEHALALARGESMYRPLDREPWIVGSYPPLFALVYAVVNGPRAGMESLGRGRVLVVAATLAAALLMAWIVGRRTRSPLAAVLTPLLFLVSYETYQWSAFVRVDLPALAWTMAGVAVAVTARGRWALPGAALLFVAAGLTKQTAVTAPLACALALARTDRRALGRFAATGLAAGLLALGGLTLWTGGEWFRHLVLSNINRMDWVGWRRLMANEIWFFHRWLLLAAIAAAAARWALRRTVAEDLGSRIVGWYALLATASLLGYAKVGAAPNYVLEPLAAWALWTGDGVGRLLSELRTRPSRRVITGALVVAALAAAHGARTQFNRAQGRPLVLWSAEPSAAWEATGRAVLQAVRSAPGEVFCEEPIYAMLAGKRVLWQPFIMAQLVREGRADETPMVERLRAGRFDVVVVTAELETDAGAAAYHPRYTPAMIEALREAYRLERIIAFPGAPRVYRLWTPRGAAHSTRGIL